MNLRNFDTCDRVEWDELEEELEGIQLSDDEDSMRWILTDGSTPRCSPPGGYSARDRV
jgi:hypothetical protein